MEGIKEGCRRWQQRGHGCRRSRSPARFGTGARCGRWVPLAIFLWFCWGPAFVAQAAEAPAAIDAEKQFTIGSIEPDADSRTVRMRFTQAIPFKVLRDHLKVYPSVGINWSKSSYDDKQVLTLHGEFHFGERHVISLPDNLEVDGKTYAKTVDGFVMPDMPAGIKFVGGKTVIERDSRQLLHVRLQNVERIQFQGIRVPPLLLPVALAAVGGEASASWEETLAQLQSATDQARPLVGNNAAYRVFLGAPFQEQQLFFTSVRKNTPHAFSMPLTFRKDKDRGAIELVRVTGSDAAAAVAGPAQLVRITDMGLTYKVSAQNLLIWSTSLKAGTPQKAVALLACTRGLEVFPIGKTDDTGILIYQPRELDGLSLRELGRVTAVKRRVPIEDIAYLVAAADQDVSFIAVKPQGDISPADIRQAGGEHQEQRLLQRYVFTERGIYRPGDTVYFKGAVREYRDGKIVVPEGGACTFEVTDAKGDKPHAATRDLSAFGTASGEFALKTYYPLGTYTLTMRYGANLKEVATCTFEVQEFRPPRHYTELSFNRETRADTSMVNRKQDLELLKVDISGIYYAGGPVKHGQVRWKIFHAKTEHPVKGYPDFTFGYQGQDDRELLESGEAVLDDSGRAQVEFPLDREVLSGKQALEVVASVIDFDGRAASTSRTFQITPDFLVGISRHPQKVISEEGQTLKVVVVDRVGRRVETGHIEAAVLKRSGVYVRKRNEEGNLYGHHEVVWRKIFASDLAIKKGEATFDFDFGWFGDHLLTFTYRDDRGRQFASATRYEVGGYGRYDEEEHPEKAYEHLPMFATKEFYRPGETARVLFGRRRPVTTYLMTVERSGVLERRVIPAKTDLKNIDIAIKPDHVPNVYVSMLGVSARGAFPVYTGRYDAEAPNFVFGAVNLPVHVEPRQLKIGIGQGSDKLRSEPGEALTLDLTVADEQGHPVEAELALGVVDESILALTRYISPSLETLTRFDSPLGVFTGELRTQLLHQTPFDWLKMEAATGGDGGEEGAGMTGKVRKRFQPVAYFNPSVVTDASGHAQVNFTLPDTMTTYRLYAVACDRGAQFGSAQRALQAVKPFYLEAGLPSFFTAGDRFQFSVAVFNSLEQGGQVEFSATTSPELKLTTARPAYDLVAMGSTKIPVSGEALLPGKAIVTFSGRLRQQTDEGRAKGSQVSSSKSQVPSPKEQTDTVQLAVPVNSRYVSGSEIQYGSVKGAGDIRMPLPEAAQNATWDQTAEEQLKCRLTLAKTPYLRMTEAIKYLLHYPYGCVEQTSSGVMPLAALRGLVAQGAVPEVSLDDVDKYLSRGVERLFGMQTASGGFGYWPGYTQAHLWGTIYAGMALSVAGANGYAIPPERLKRTMEYLKRELKRGHQDDTARGFIAYILALNGQFTDAILEDVTRGLENPSYETTLMVLLATSKAGLVKEPEMPDRARQLLATPPEETTFGEFHARYRTRAVALLAATALLPGDALTDAAAERLLAGLGKHGMWTSTSDTGWALLALHEYYRNRPGSTAAVRVVVHQANGETNTTEISPLGFQVVELGARTFLKNPSVRLESDSDQELLYKLELLFPRVDYAATGHAGGFRVAKTIENTDGTGQIRVGDVVKVQVHLDVTDESGSYVVLDDPLPAGLMAINSALKTEETVSGSNADQYDALFRGPDGVLKFAPSFFEIRDDRVLAFRDRIWRGAYVFTYYARAVCAGDFVMPSTKVQLMYAPEINGYTPLGRMVIEGR